VSEDHHIQEQHVWRHLRGHMGDITGIAFSGDGRMMLSCSKDETIRVWSLIEGEKSTTLVEQLQ
jgi:WD40 repeat protein